MRRAEHRAEAERLVAEVIKRHDTLMESLAERTVNDATLTFSLAQLQMLATAAQVHATLGVDAPDSSRKPEAG